MTYLLKLHPEITIKSRSVRQHMTRCLASNVRNTLRQRAEGVRVKAGWDALRVKLPETLTPERERELAESLSRIPGIHEVLATEEVPCTSLEEAADWIVPHWKAAIAGRRFRVRAKRRGDHAFSSVDLERHLGSALLAAEPSAQVDLKHPEVVVSVELTHHRLQLFRSRRPGLGGYPLGVQGEALALVSGGFDSPVAAWRMLRRGIKTHYLFFNLGGPAHEAGVKEVTHHLWQRYSASHNVDFTSVPFEPVVAEILRSIPDGLMGVVLKRMMVRVASRIAARSGIPMLVTGDAIAQVSSQTLTNLALIDAASERPILRPLVTEDKQEIIDTARRIDTARFAEQMPEYCGVISRRPHTRAPTDKVLAAEADFDFTVLDAAVEAATVTRASRLMEERRAPGEVTVVDSPTALAERPAVSVIDIRPPDECEAAPLELDVPCLEIPFYELQDQAETLPDDREYLLYCDQGVMSRMQALHLADRGLDHFGVYRRTGTEG
ncbi:tRNA 4-thiouridine(8) synthase ThiI [Halomonas aestuarii]|uniref:Probable tRNA sulfurtransferase n=1 Tax=Halomonas aestuarii TaxID=1897729 RepID=A0A1J0VBZ6_9GAMM|nr:tRNA uracil 4-sulfurtransferase ThiI [Halomonas aestuarii]APE29540.1 tRNA 4-thiouridine(8) synthase ThiI [Halomonas aestuarii]